MPEREVRTTAARYALEPIARVPQVWAWIIDDTGFSKKGAHSVGVQRHYTGSAGKITNCQIGVSLTLATLLEHVPVDFELYLPEPWTDVPERRAEAKTPEEIESRPSRSWPLVAIRLASLAPSLAGYPRCPICPAAKQDRDGSAYAEN